MDRGAFIESRADRVGGEKIAGESVEFDGKGAGVIYETHAIRADVSGE